MRMATFRHSTGMKSHSIWSRFRTAGSCRARPRCCRERRRGRVVAEGSSATAPGGTPFTAILTEPLYSPTHQLILPANSRLVGEVIKAKSARKLHRNGELRVVFERIETSEEAMRALGQLQLQAQAQAEHSQAMVGNLEGVEVDRRANMQLDEEGGAHTTDSKTRYLSSGL